jgi:hypothetical protein
LAPAEVQTSTQDAPRSAAKTCEIVGSSAAVRMAKSAIQDVHPRAGLKYRMVTG